MKSESSDDMEDKVITEVLTKAPQTSLTSPKTIPMLAPESWELIFREVYSTDFLSVINSVPEWNHLLRSRKTVELFPNVLPFVMRFLPKPDFLSTRLVCRDWKKGADYVYETHPSRLASLTSDLKFPKLTPSGRFCLSVDTGIKFQTVESFQRFTTQMNLDSGNPFPGRCVWLLLLLKREETEEEEDDDYNSDEEEEEINNHPLNNPDYWTSLTSLLTQFGEHIWYLRLHYFVGYENDPVEMRLQNILRLVLNLRKLELTLGSDDGLDWNRTFNNRVISYFTANPPSKLDKLEVFSFNASECDEEVHPVILQLIKSYCADGMLKRLNLDICLAYDEPIPLPELIELSTVMDYKALPKLKEASPKLEILSVHFNYEEGVHHGPGESDSDYDINEDEDGDPRDFDDEVEYDDCNISTIFDGLHLFGGTLKKLNIDDNGISCNKRILQSAASEAGETVSQV